ncbi:hypothetical protein FH972_025941 [Carpinus fangiana]|uniref:alanine--glyoxylate transaminase n=1 Tax=Carpinus fangiana TaxID=176857 RepID=A0A5N6L2G8_9ROSI|nr:hypothetical protein FH972_025941 [Carpinus fangiana]
MASSKSLVRVPARLHTSRRPSCLSHSSSLGIHARMASRRGGVALWESQDDLASNAAKARTFADSRSMPRATSSTKFPINSSTATAQLRLNSISRHLQSRPTLELNTPYSTERFTSHERESDPQAPTSARDRQSEAMSSSQAPHPTVLIPGPIEYDDAVLESMSHFSQSHVGAPFVNTFSEVLTMTRKLVQTTNPKSQPFVISGSGTLGWDQVASNLCERGDEALVLHTGYFGDSFADCFETYGVNATQLKAPIGDRPQLPEIEKALKEKKYKVLTVTHVDTSTGVLSELEELTKLVRRVSPETLVVVDGVCSVGAEDIRFDEMDLDLVMTASQKAIGCPAGLSIVVASERAMNVFNARKTRPASYFASWKNWAPIMQNYEAKKPSYFATPSPQLIHALHTALTQLLSIPLKDRFAQHKKVSQEIKDQIKALGLEQLASKPENQASTMTAVYLPDGTIAPEFLPGLLERGVVFAGGLHKEIAAKYIRFGHMGVSVMNPKRGDIEKAVKALADRVAEVRASKK